MAGAPVNLTSCCKQCADCAECYDHSVTKVRDLLYAINFKLSDNLEQQVCEMQWGYSQRRPVAKNKLHVYRRAVSKHLSALENGYPTCLCPQEFQLIYEDALSIVGLSCCKDPQRRDLVVDKSGLDAWNVLNTGCVVYEEWEKSFKKVCPTLGIKVENATTLAEVTKLVYTLSVSTYDSCAVLYNIKAATISMQENCYDYRWTATPVQCDLTVLAKVTPKDMEKCLSYGLTSEQISECKLGYDVLVKNTQCKMSFGTYIDLLSCNLTTEILSNLINCGISVSFDAEKLCPVLEVGKTSVHLYDDLDLQNLNEDIFSCDFQLTDI